MSVDDYTDDEKWLIVTGRRWRRTDPGLEPRVVEELKSHLGAARNAVGKAKKAGAEDDLAEARRRVNAAKIGLGERGDYWWEMAIEDRRARGSGPERTAVSSLRAAGSERALRRVVQRMPCNVQSCETAAARLPSEDSRSCSLTTGKLIFLSSSLSVTALQS